MNTQVSPAAQSNPSAKIDPNTLAIFEGLHAIIEDIRSDLNLPRYNPGSVKNMPQNLELYLAPEI